MSVLGQGLKRTGFHRLKERYPRLSFSEMVILSERARAGDTEARNYMAMSNLKLITYAMQRVRSKEGYNDLHQDGFLGLLQACATWDPAKGAAFSTHAIRYIKTYAERSRDRCIYVLRLPVYVMDEIGQLHRAEGRLEERFGREPQSYELAAELGISEERVIFLANAWARATTPPEPLHEGPADEPWADLIADERPFGDSLDAEDWSPLLSRLKPRERQALELRYGLNDGIERTLQECGAVMRCTRERVRQIEAKALAKLRTWMRSAR